jgi:radical SAM modification target selenobiotic family peptide
METRDLNKFLSGLCIAGLLAGASLTLAGCPEKPGSS